MKVALLEFIDEFESFEKYILREGLGLNEFLIVAIEPKLEAYLRSKNILYHNTLPYFNNESHRNIIVETEKITEDIRRRFVFTDSNGISGSYKREYLFYLRVFINHILKLLEIIHNIFKEDNDLKLYASLSYSVSPTPLIGESERYCGVIAKAFAGSRGLEFININEDKETAAIPAKDNNRTPYFTSLFLKGIIWSLRKKKVAVIPRTGAFGTLIPEIAGHDPEIFFLSVDSSLKGIKLISANIFLFFKNNILIRQPKLYVINASLLSSYHGQDEGKLLDVIDRMLDKESDLYNFCGVDYFSLVKKKAESAFKPHLCKMLSYSYALKYIFERLGRMLVMSQIGSGIMAVAGETAKVLKRRSLFVSHGTHPVPVDPYHEMELNVLSRTFMLGDYTHVALSTPVQEAHLHYFKEKYGDIDNKEVKTGPLIFAGVNSEEKAQYKKDLGIDPGKIVLTHAVTTKLRQGERFYFLETLDEFISGLADVVNAINSIDNTFLIIRIHPGFYLTNEEIKILLPESCNYLIHREGPFSDALSATDILLSYSSTAIDEALSNKVPVLLFDKWNRYNHFKTGVFDSSGTPDIFPVCYVNTKDKLHSALEFMIEKVRTLNKGDLDVSRYRYSKDYKENFYDFIDESLRYAG